MTECSCPIKPNMTYDELVNDILRAGKNCGDQDGKPGWVCANLDKELRRADKDRQYGLRRQKQMAARGFEVKDIPTKQGKHPKSIKPVKIDLSGL